MSSSKIANLIEVKQKLVVKYDRLATKTKSPAQQKKWNSRANCYRQQILQMQHDSCVGKN